VCLVRGGNKVNCVPGEGGGIILAHFVHIIKSKLYFKHIIKFCIDDISICWFNIIQIESSEVLRK